MKHTLKGLTYLLRNCLFVKTYENFPDIILMKLEVFEIHNSFIMF